MTYENIVIIGTGQGAFQLATSLRQKKFEGNILLIGEEKGLPYQRPPLSKAYLKDGNEKHLELRPETYFYRNKIDLLSGTRVSKIDTEQKSIQLEKGEVIKYDHLILATGTRNLKPRIENLDLSSVFELRTKQDADKIRNFMKKSRNILIIGGGFIGLEFAAVANLAGHSTIIIEANQRLMERAVSPATSKLFARYHRDQGAEIFLGKFVVKIINDGNGNACGVELNDGQIINADMILVAAGVVPNVELAVETNIETKNGIVVDSTMLTSDPNVSALGDCANFPEPLTKTHQRLESVQAATDHARTIASRLTGSQLSYDKIPWFWSTQGDLKLQIVGLSNITDNYHVFLFSSNDKFCVFCFKDKILVAIETVNSPKEHMQGRKLLAFKFKITKNELEDVNYDLSKIIDKNKEK